MGWFCICNLQSLISVRLLTLICLGSNASMRHKSSQDTPEQQGGHLLGHS